jgi:hypothetical protein
MMMLSWRSLFRAIALMVAFLDKGSDLNVAALRQKHL